MREEAEETLIELGKANHTATEANSSIRMEVATEAWRIGAGRMPPEQELPTRVPYPVPAPAEEPAGSDSHFDSAPVAAEGSGWSSEARRAAPAARIQRNAAASGSYSDSNHQWTASCGGTSCRPRPATPPQRGRSEKEAEARAARWTFP